jgi:D-sedoheptulose 7-phosphate isomerase
MEDIVREIAAESLRVTESFLSQNAGLAVSAATMAAESYCAGKKIVIFGNGGSAADAQHLAAEFVNRFRLERRALPALALTTDTSVLTAIGNDYSFEDVFARQVQAIGRVGDVAWGISTSGRSKNVILAMEAARSLGMRTIGFSGNGGGDLAELSEFAFVVQSRRTPRIQEAHITMGHVICDLVERILFPLTPAGD